MTNSFEEMAIWYKAINFAKMKSILEGALPTPLHRLAYELTDGERSTRDIERLASERGFKASHRTISSWQDAWVQKGLVRQISPYKRKRLFDLNTFGWDAAPSQKEPAGPSQVKSSA